jgi:hypothetical protein
MTGREYPRRACSTDRATTDEIGVGPAPVRHAQNDNADL